MVSVGVETGSEALSPRRAATRQRLVDAAESVFARRGVMAASVEEICDEAGFTRGAFYSNFATKEELCLALLDSRGEREFEAAQSAIRNAGVFNGSIDAVINEAIRLFVHALPRTRESVLAFDELRLYAAREPEFRQPFEQGTARLGKMLAQMLDATVRDRGLTMRIDAEELLDVMHGVWYDAAMKQLVRQPASADDLPLDISFVTRRMATLMSLFLVADPA